MGLACSHIRQNQGEDSNKSDKTPTPSIKTEASGATTMSGTVNRISAQEGQEVYEGEGAETSQQILQDDEGCRDV